jgi:hypothetical protein
MEFKNKATGLFLDGLYNYANGSILGQWSNNGSTAQEWTLTVVGLVGKQVTESQEM